MTLVLYMLMVQLVEVHDIEVCDHHRHLGKPVTNVIEINKILTQH